MGETKKIHQLFQDSWFQHDQEEEEEEDHVSTPSSSSTITSSIGEESTLSNGSSVTSSDVSDDASSSSSFSPNLFDLSEIMTQLPIKRGLSKFYQGKSESFASLSRVTSIDDLAKKANANRRINMRASQSIGTGLQSYKCYTLPKAIIAKKSSCKRH